MGEGGSDGSGSGDSDGSGGESETGSAQLVVCGDSECAGGEICMSFVQEPACENKLEGQPCPEGTDETLCGGAGIACCCGPVPAPVNECAAPAGCDDVVDCACLGDICFEECSATATEGVFMCTPLPVP